jgi:hypothetical protein
MTKRHSSRTRDGRPAAGGRVILTNLPKGFLDDLPEEDRVAINAVNGKPILLIEYDDIGRAELEFTDRRGVTHSIWVGTEFVRPVK